MCRKRLSFILKFLEWHIVNFNHQRGGAVRQSLHFGTQKINLHDAASPFWPHARNPAAGSIDLCFITQQPLGDWQQHLTNCGIVIENGPVRKAGANGPLLSIYIRDPDGNLVEISNYIEPLK